MQRPYGAGVLPAHDSQGRLVKECADPQIENQSHDKSLLGQTNVDQTLTPALREQAKLTMKDEDTFDVLELGTAHSERELEQALIAKVEEFLRVMGGLFAFMGSQCGGVAASAAAGIAQRLGSCPESPASD